MIVCRPLIARTDDHTHYVTFFNFLNPSGIYLPRVKKIIIIIITDLYSAVRSEDTEALGIANMTSRTHKERCALHAKKTAVITVFTFITERKDYFYGRRHRNQSASY